MNYITATGVPRGSVATQATGLEPIGGIDVLSAGNFEKP
jgi:hypothetical protein